MKLEPADRSFERRSGRRPAGSTAGLATARKERGRSGSGCLVKFVTGVHFSRFPRFNEKRKPALHRDQRRNCEFDPAAEPI